MNEFRTVFKRLESKYMLNTDQYKEIMDFLKEYIVPDEYCKSMIFNLYFDTPDFELIRRSMQRPAYKEKLRLRSYCVPENDTMSFIEIKKKYKGVVYKRRVSATYRQSSDYLMNNINTIESSQIMDEIDWFKKHYGSLKPQMFIGYSRKAYRGKNDCNFRITFDSNITWRDYDLDLKKGCYGEKLLEDDKVLMEVKFANAMPLWLADELDRLNIFKTSFSKYGNAYLNVLAERKEKGEIYCA